MIYNLRRFFIFLILIFATANLNAQSFPERCEGIWKGTMQIWSRGVIADSVEVKLTIQRLNDTSKTWMWKTEYLSEKMPLTKDYILVERNASIGLYITDEGDGIELTNYLFGTKLYSVFEVEGNVLTASYELVGDQLIFEVTSGKKIKAKKKDVGNFSVDFLQRVVFSRVQ